MSNSATPATNAMTLQQQIGRRKLNDDMFKISQRLDCR